MDNEDFTFLNFILVIIIGLLFFYLNNELENNEIANNQIMDLNLKLDNRNSKINNLEIKLDKISNSLDDKQNNINVLYYNLNEKKEQINNLTELLDSCNVIVNNLDSSITKLKKGNIKNKVIEMDDLEDFLYYNDIDNNNYDIDDYNCVDFSHDLIKDFYNEGYIAYEVTLYFTDDTGHALVSIEVEDIGIIFIEPQTDDIIYELEIGDEYLDWGNDWEIENIKYMK